MSDLGKLLKKLRGNHSLREASKITGISHNYLSIVERGLDPRSGAPVSPTPDTLKKLAEAYHYPYEELMKVAGYIEESKTQKEVADKLIELLELDLTNEEIKDRFTFKVDNMTLTDEEMDEFIDFVRVKRLMKKQQQTVSKADEL